MKIRLGQRVRDIVTGFEGIAESRVEYLNGCVRYAVAPGLDKDRKWQDSRYIDQEQLAVVNDGVAPQLAAPSPSGGERDTPSTRQAPPTRGAGPVR